MKPDVPLSVTMLTVMELRCIHHVRKKRDQQYFLHNFDKFKCIIVIFCYQHREVMPYYQ